MVRALESLGAQLLGKFVPEVKADATGCSCDPGSRWCVNPDLYLGNEAYCVWVSPVWGCRVDYTYTVRCFFQY